jgi:hypothetical protein
MKSGEKWKKLIFNQGAKEDGNSIPARQKGGS